MSGDRVVRIETAAPIPPPCEQETTMRSMLWIAASGALLASGSARAGPGLPYAHDDVVYPDDVAEASDPRRVDVTITERGPQPSEVQVNGPEKVQLVVTR